MGVKTRCYSRTDRDGKVDYRRDLTDGNFFEPPPPISPFPHYCFQGVPNRISNQDNFVVMREGKTNQSCNFLGAKFKIKELKEENIEKIEDP